VVVVVSIGGYEADRHSFHHDDLHTDIQAIRDQSNRAQHDKYRPHSSVIHFHKSDQTCVGKHHEFYLVEHPFVPEQRTPHGGRDLPVKFSEMTTN
jgi:hypothetical protein